MTFEDSTVSQASSSHHQHQQQLLPTPPHHSKRNTDSLLVDDQSRTHTTQIVGKHSADSLMEKARQILQSSPDIPLALQFTERALLLDGLHCDALELTGSLLMETGEMERAKECFVKLIELPDNGPTTDIDAARATGYFYLGQMASGREAYQYITRGVAILERQQSVVDDDVELRRKLSSAYCSLAELYMTDYCFEDDAEEKCSSFVDKAIGTCSDNPEAYQTQCSLLLAQNRPHEAKQAFQTSLSLWLPQAADDSDTKSMPFQTRLQCVRLAVDMRLYNTAITVLQGLVREDDTDMEGWYMFAFTYWCMAAETIRQILEADFDASNLESTADDPVLNDEEMDDVQLMISRYITKVSDGSILAPARVYDLWIYAMECIEEVEKIHKTTMETGGVVAESLVDQSMDLYASLKRALQCAPTTAIELSSADSPDMEMDITDEGWQDNDLSGASSSDGLDDYE
jgi:tetratricopeptide (TPR) repeat protein